MSPKLHPLSLLRGKKTTPCPPLNMYMYVEYGLTIAIISVFIVSVHCVLPIFNN